MKPFQLNEPKSSKTLQIVYSVLIYLGLELTFTIFLNVISGVTPQEPNLPSWGVVVFWIYTLTLWIVPYKYFTDKNKKLSKPQVF
jgi:hypothetical protein